MIRHLIGGGPGRRDVLTECCLTEALPGTLVKAAEYANCPDCRWSLMTRGVCPNCEEKALEWQTSRKKLTAVGDGQLRMHDVTAIFYLSCGYCSETLIPEVDLDTVAAYLTRGNWMPPRRTGEDI